MTLLKVFIVEDEEILRVTLADDLKEAGYQVETFADPREVLTSLEKNMPDVVITDIKMPHLSGLELLTRIKTRNPDLPVIIMTAFGSVDSAVQAMKEGAYDYIAKPFNIEEMLLRLERLSELQSVRKENRRLRSLEAGKYPLEAFVGISPAVQQIHQMVRTVADTQSTVLITGETGTGKELLANIVHYNSSRRDKPFVKVSCAILSRDVFESELFGHEKGAFTGAAKSREGRFEMADGGSLYLDDVDDIPLEMQVKLLRVLQERELERVGGNKTIKVDVRVIASTKADLKKLVAEGAFREDLYYRLNVFPIHLAPLRERPEDILQLIHHFEKEFCTQCRLEMSEAVQQRLQQYHWPGNVRELKNIVERLVLTTQCCVDDTSKLPPEIVSGQAAALNLNVGEQKLDEILQEVEISLIRKALETTRGHQARAAEMLGIPPSTLRTKMHKYQLTPEK